MHEHNQHMTSSSIHYGQQIPAACRLWLPSDYSQIPKLTIFAATTLNGKMADKDKNFGLSREEFDSLALNLKQGDHTLFRNIFMVHYKDSVSYLCKKYAANHEDAYDAVMETLLQFRQLILSNKIGYGNLRFLFTRMAGQYYFRQKNKNPQSLDPEIENLMEDQDSFPIHNEEMEILALTWKNLKPECQELLSLNYYSDLSLEEIAEQQGRNAAAVRKQKERCKEALIHLYQIQLKKYSDE